MYSRQRKPQQTLAEGAETAQTRVQQTKGCVWRKLPRRQVPRPRPLEEREGEKEGRESGTGFSAATVPAASRMTTAAVAGIAGNTAITRDRMRSVIHRLDCRDKTKFGGQNRLRQKCLHRRCLLDTHRRNGGSGPATTSEQGIYSGLELARLQQNSSGDHSIFSLLGRSHPFCLNFPHTGGRQTLAIL